MTRGVVLGLVVAAIIGGLLAGLAIGEALAGAQTCERAANGLPVVVDLRNADHANLIAHERDAIDGHAPGELSPRAPAHAERFLTWDPAGADARRRQDLRGIPTRAGFDRDEYPPASTRESGLQPDGSSASVAYVASSENRSGGQLLGRAMAGYCAGQRLVIEAGRP
jgi:hypothetical protein